MEETTMRNITILDNTNNREENIVTNAPADIIQGLAVNIAKASRTNFLKVLLDTLKGCGYTAYSTAELFA